MIERTWLLPRATTSTNNVANVIPRAIGTRANISKRRRRNMFMVAACHRSFETTQSAKQRNARFAKPLAASFKTLTTPPSNPPNLGWLLRGHAPQPRMMGPPPPYRQRSSRCLMQIVKSVAAVLATRFVACSEDSGNGCREGLMRPPWMSELIVAGAGS